MVQHDVTSRETPGASVRALRIVTVALGLIVLGLSVWVVVARFRYRVDAEWMVGAIRDGVERVRDGKRLYVEPSEGFIPFIYGPLYFWVAGAVSHVLSVFVACKLVSIAATAVLGWGIFTLSRSFGATRFWAWIAVLLHVACYPLTLFFFDLERVDATAAALVMVGVIALLRSEALGWTIVGGALLGLSFFAKQLDVAALLAASFGLFVANQRKRAAVALGAGVVVVAVLYMYLQVRTGGWFRFYCITIPGEHGIDPKLLSAFFIYDAPRAFALTGATVAIIAPTTWAMLRHRRLPDGQTWRETVFACVVGAALAGAYFMRAHKGGWVNVDVFWTPLACTSVAIVAARAEERVRGAAGARIVSTLLLGGISIQFLAAMFDPNDNSPNEDDLAATQRLHALVARLEKQGEVVVSTTGNITHPRHFHDAAMYDILRSGEHPTRFIEGMKQQRFVAMLVGDPLAGGCDLDSCKEFVETKARYYFVAARREEREHSGMTGFDARPRWILRPRRKPLLDPDLDAEQLAHRQLVEMGIAEMRRRATKSDVESEIDDDIEELAAKEPSRGP